MNIRSIVLWLGCITFLLFAGLQFNDATQFGNYDAWSWIILYSITSLLSAFVAKKHIDGSLLSAWVGFTFGSLFFRLQDEQGNFHFEHLNPFNLWHNSEAQLVQNTNESTGLLIMFIWCIILFFLNKQSNRSQ